jgi:hypothetical protein
VYMKCPSLYDTFFLQRENFAIIYYIICFHTKRLQSETEENLLKNR